MAGYNGYSMSNNAVAAYANGEKPYSKWTKTEILSEIPESIRGEAKQLTASELKALFLKRTSWHHTSSHFNHTDFYSISEDVSIEMIHWMISQRTPKQPKAEPKQTKALVWYGEWEGTRKHPKLVEHSSFAIIVDNWAYLPAMKGETRRKRTDGKHFRILETYPRAPEGTAEAFKLIERSIKS